jgi:hypothetical protein
MTVCTITSVYCYVRPIYSLSTVGTIQYSRASCQEITARALTSTAFWLSVTNGYSEHAVLYTYSCCYTTGSKMTACTSTSIWFSWRTLGTVGSTLAILYSCCFTTESNTTNTDTVQGYCSYSTVSVVCPGLSSSCLFKKRSTELIFSNRRVSLYSQL